MFPFWHDHLIHDQERTIREQVEQTRRRRLRHKRGEMTSPPRRPAAPATEKI